MIKKEYFNDSPITNPDEDDFGVDSFAKGLARGIAGFKSPIGTTFALNGPWGSGKSSAVNLILHHLRNDEDSKTLEIIDFKCWWFRGEESLTLAFLRELNNSISKNLGDKAKDLIPKIGRLLLQSGPIIGTAMNFSNGGILGVITGEAVDFAKKYFPEGESVEKLFQELSNKLGEQQDKRFLVLVDDIDRLTSEEALLVFRLIKSVGRLPNVMYLLVFDRGLAEKAVAERYPSEGPHFLEKIIQASFELPLPVRDDLNRAVQAMIETICGPPRDEEQILRFKNIFYEIISPSINIPRDLIKLSNSMAIGWSAVASEVDVADFVALEAIRQFKPKLYELIRTKKNIVCGIGTGFGEIENSGRMLNEFLGKLPENDREFGRLALMMLFPRFEKISYSEAAEEKWGLQRRVCSSKHFDTYFKMAIGDETLSMAEINEFVEQCGEESYVQEVFKAAVKSIRKNGRSKVPLLFDEIIIHSPRIEKKKFQGLILAIFKIADDIYRDEDSDQGGYSIGDNYLRIHWFIRKLTLKRCGLYERSKIFIEACKSAQIGWLVDFTSSAYRVDSPSPITRCFCPAWLVDFTSSAYRDHFPRENREPEPPENCLVKRDDIFKLKDQTIEKIDLIAKAGGLISHPQLSHILFKWKDLSGDDVDRVKDWTREQMKNDEAISMFARAFTGKNGSYDIGRMGLRDQTAIPKTKALVSGLEDVIDVTEFRKRMEEITTKKPF